MRRGGLEGDAFGSGPTGFPGTQSCMCCFCVSPMLVLCCEQAVPMG